MNFDNNTNVENIINIIKGGALDNCKKENYQVSLLIGTYNPDISKLLVTINSGIVQEKVDLQIVITDDGSKSFDPKPIISFFESVSFHDYVITALEENRGTTKNFYNGLKYCKGEYTKLISPGDYLNGTECLSKWLGYIKENKAVVSFAGCVHYCYEYDSVKAVSVIADPQNIKDFYKNSWAYNYIVFDDVVTGACTLAKTEKLLEYSEYILDKVIYTEDNIYRLMSYNNEPACYFDKDTVLYEHGSGVSTNGNQKWLDRIFADYVAADSIMLQWNNDSVVAKQFAKIAYIRTEKRVLLRKFKVLIFLISSGKYKFVLKKKFNPRYTNISFDADYVDRIHNINLNI